MPHKYFSIDGVATFVHHTGSTTLPDVPPDLSLGETIVCLHGAGGNGGQFQQVLAGLAAEHSPLAFDQPAHGRSAGLDSLGSLERMAGFTRSLLGVLGIESPVLLGHSLGGAVALQCALDGGPRVRGLVLVGAVVRDPVPDEYLEFARRLSEGKERRRFPREGYAVATPPEIMRRGFMEDLKTDPRATYGDLRAARACDLSEALSGLDLPTLVVVGEEEAEQIVAQADLLIERVRGAHKVTIPKAGHMVLIEQPDALCEAVTGFLRELT